MKRVDRDGESYDLFGFVLGYEGYVGLRRWREAPPLAVHQDEREIALDGMLTRSAPCLWRERVIEGTAVD